MKRGEGEPHRLLVQDGTGRPGPSYGVNQLDSYEEEEEEDDDGAEAEAAIYINRRSPRRFFSRPRPAEEEERLLPSTDFNTLTRPTNISVNTSSYSSISPITTAPPNSLSAGSTQPVMAQSYPKAEPMKYPSLPLPGPTPSSTGPSEVPQAASDDALIRKNALADAGSTITLDHDNSPSACGASHPMGLNHPAYPPPVIIPMNDPDRPTSGNVVIEPLLSPSSEEKRCRICLDVDNETELGRLISPCLCKGSSRYIHLNCLQRWRELSPRKESFYRCDTCHYHYSFSRPWMAKVLDRVWFPHVATVLIMFFVIYGFGWIGRVLYDKDLWHWKAANQTRIMGLDGADYVFGMVWLALLALVIWCIGLTIGVASGDRSGSGGGCDCRGCFFLDCAGGSGDGEACAIVCIVLLILAGTVAAFVGIYLVIEDLTTKALANMKNSILEVK
ncbi:hypothetical protein EMPS_04611 [Entomortierella parvispora]|uniref:RING-CH-type domain-containing protein n=1 Tax=Entomortierella parvispora TaxID=205924 RepID=A0A9P3H8S9_9FUNG|nr:hypothetical protein EMPS_04611 [Entomortierella parvispora]